MNNLVPKKFLALRLYVH